MSATDPTSSFVKLNVSVQKQLVPSDLISYSIKVDLILHLFGTDSMGVFG